MTGARTGTTFSSLLSTSFVFSQITLTSSSGMISPLSSCSMHCGMGVIHGCSICRSWGKRAGSGRFGGLAPGGMTACPCETLKGRAATRRGGAGVYAAGEGRRSHLGVQLRVRVI